MAAPVAPRQLPGSPPVLSATLNTEPAMKICPHCNGRGWVGDSEDRCLECNGTGQVEDDDPGPAPIREPDGDD